MSTQYDVAIAGGGLAGLAAAIELGRLGRRVVVLEQGDYPRHKVCGEYLSLESWPYLQRLGLDLDALAPPVFNTFRLTTHLGGDFQTRLPLGGFGLSRYMLDHQLALAAQRTGAELRTLAPVKAATPSPNGWVLSTPQEEVHATLALGATGKRSSLELALNNGQPRHHLRQQPPDAHNYVAVKLHLHAPDFPANRIELHLFPEGYGGISRVEGTDDTVCFCWMTTARQMKRHGSIEALHTNLLSRNPNLAHYLANYPSHYSKPLAISNVRFNRRRNPEADLPMAGDAAGLVAPLSGNGMSMALHAGWLWASHAQAALCGRMTVAQANARYAKAWRKRFGTRLAAGRLLQDRFFSPWLLHQALPIFHAWPGLARGLIRQTHGKPFGEAEPEAALP